MPALVLAHDLGTSGNKASLYDEYGRLVASFTSPYATHYFHGNWAEQDPDDWWLAVCRSTREVLAHVEAADVVAIGFSGHMTGCLPIDRDGRVLRPHILWADQRAGEQKRWIDERIDAKTLFHLTGHRSSETTTLAKIRWIMDKEPAVARRTAAYLNAKDYLVYRLTGVVCTDPSDASATTLFDIRTRTWSEDLLERFGVPADKMPGVRPSASVVGHLLKEAALDLGLPSGVPVVTGGGDGPAANLGAGCIAPGRVHVCIGTSGWLMESTDAPKNEVQDGTFNFCHVIENMYSPTGTMQSAGSSYAWLSGLLGVRKADRDALEADMRLSGPGANGVLFLPYLMGERAPYWNPKAKGAFLGLKQETTAADMTRAVLEGVALHLNVIRRRLDPDGLVKQISAVGGGARSDLWCQILADVLQTDIRRLCRLEEAGGLGAAVLAGVGVGLYPDYSVIDAFQSVERVFVPSAEKARFYQNRTDMQEHVYLTTKDIMATLADEDTAWHG
ncbi:MAG TPA: xylulokinase [Clostridiaceae bacterium]|nr:xylulokinase [Clostridiaceae bacterium]